MEQIEVEGTFKSYVVQPSCNEQGHLLGTATFFFLFYFSEKDW